VSICLFLVTFRYSLWWCHDWVLGSPEVSIQLTAPRGPIQLGADERADPAGRGRAGRSSWARTSGPIQLGADERLVNRSGTADHTGLMAALPLPPADLDRYVFMRNRPAAGAPNSW